jgi:hypothetical protein
VCGRALAVIYKAKERQNEWRLGFGDEPDSPDIFFFARTVKSFMPSTSCRLSAMGPRETTPDAPSVAFVQVRNGNWQVHRQHSYRAF